MDIVIKNKEEDIAIEAGEKLLENVTNEIEIIEKRETLKILTKLLGVLLIAENIPLYFKEYFCFETKDITEVIICSSFLEL